MKATAANSSWMMKLAPLCEIVAFDNALEQEVARGDRRLGNDALLQLWAAACMRWPEAINKWCAATAIEGGLGLSAGPRRWAPKDWALANASVAKALGELPMPERKLACKLDDSQEAAHSTQMWLQLLGVAACNHAEGAPANKRKVQE